MKIAIIQTHPIQHFCPQFASYAKLPGIEIKVFFETDKGLKTYFDKSFGKEIRFTNIDISGFDHQFLNNISVEHALEQYQPDAVVIYGYAKKIQRKAYKYAKSNHIKIFYVSDSENHHAHNRIKEFVKRQVLKPFFSRVDYCLSVGDANEDVYRSYGVTNDRIIRMFFPINIQFFDQLLSKKQEVKKTLLRDLEIDPKHIVIATIGKLVSFKRQRDIIDLLHHLENKGIDATAFIIGSGQDEALLIDKCKILEKNKIVFTGFIQPEKMAEYLCATDIYIHPASYEPHSLAISEAIYCGCPVILSDCCGSYGPTDDVQPGKNGFVYPVGNIEQLTNLVIRLVNDKKLLEQMSEASTGISKYNQQLAHRGALQSAINPISK